MSLAVLHAIVWRALLFAALWWALADGVFAPLFGAVMVVLATFASMLLAPPRWRLRVTAIARFVPFFLWESLRGGLDVAGRTLHPRLPIAPALRVYRLRLSAGLPRVLFVATVSLLPGTVSATLAGRQLRLHVLDARQPHAVTLRRIEGHIAAMLGLSLKKTGSADEGSI